MIKTFKKAIAIMLTLVFILSLVPVSGLASTEEEPVKLYMVNYDHTRSGSDNAGKHQDKSMYTTVRTSMGGGGNNRYAMAQIDFAGYEEILANENTKLTLGIKSGATSKYGIYNFTVGVVSDNCDDYVAGSITHNIADSLGFFNESDVTTLYTRSDATAAGANVILESKIAASDILNKLNTGSDDSVVTFRFAGLTSTSSYFAATEGASSYVEIDYDASEIENQEYVNGVADKLTWNILSDDEINCAENDLNLPSKFYGADVTWKSSNPDIITDDGKVIGGKGTVETVTLTASLSYQGIEETAELGTATKDFIITCRPEEAVTVRIPFTNYAYSRNSGNKGTEYGYYTYGEYHCIRTAESFFGYAQLDLSGYEEIINNTSTKAVVSLECGLQYTSARMYGMTGHIAPDSADSYSNENITWDIADDLGLHNTADNPVLFETTGSDLKPGEVDSAAANMANLRAAIDNGKNSLVSLYFAPTGGDSRIRISSENSGLFIAYYESEIDNEDYFNSIESSFTWENITSDDADIVVNNLPTYFKGAKVAWSSGEGVITSSGELIPVAGQITDATLKATVTYGDYSFEESFTVKISDNGITINDPVLTTENGNVSVDFSVFNRTAEDITYKLYLATYKDNELMQVIPVTFIAEKGKTTTLTDTTAVFGDGYKAKFFVWSEDGITPVIKNK